MSKKSPQGNLKVTAWREMVRRVVPSARLAQGASLRALTSAESALAVGLPRELRGLLGQTNGVRSGGGTRLIWPVADLVSQNRAFRDPAQSEADLYAPFGSLLLFGEEGNGDLFAYDTAAGHSAAVPIVKWDHETDERSPFARDPPHYLRLRADTAAADGAAERGVSADAGRGVVSVWVGSYRTAAEFKAYLAAGGSGVISEDGLPLSRFQADHGLTKDDVLTSEEHTVFVPRPTDAGQLLSGVHGGHGFVPDVIRRAVAAGRARVNAAILVYGLKYVPRKATSQPGVTFVGCFEFD